MVDHINAEVLFFYCTASLPPEENFPNRALVWSLRNNTAFFRDYDAYIPFAGETLDVVDQASSNLTLSALDRKDATGRLLDLEAAPDRPGSVAVPAYIERKGLFSDPGHDWVQVDEARLQLTGNDAKLRLGGQVAVDAAVTWRDQFDVAPATDYRTDVRHNDQMIAYRVDIQTLTDWQIAALLLKVQKSGERG